MLESHRLVTKNKGVRRGGSFQQFAYGKMVPVGARVPQGGAVGDGYAPYAHMTSDSVDAIDALMAHGRVGVLVTHSPANILMISLGCRFTTDSSKAVHTRPRERVSKHQYIR